VQGGIHLIVKLHCKKTAKTPIQENQQNSNLGPGISKAATLTNF